MVFSRHNSIKCLIWAVAMLLPFQTIHGTKALAGLHFELCETTHIQVDLSGKHCCHKQPERDCKGNSRWCKQQSDEHRRLTNSDEDCSPFCWCKRNEMPQQLPTSNGCRATSAGHLTNNFVKDVDIRITLKKTCDYERKTVSMESAQVRCALLSRFLI